RAVLFVRADDAVRPSNGEGPNSGGSKGRAATEAVVRSNYELTGGTQKLDIHDIFADDLHAVVSLRETATRTGGATLDMEEAHVLTFDADGKVTNLWDLPVDPEVHDRFFDGRERAERPRISVCSKGSSRRRIC